VSPPRQGECGVLFIRRGNRFTCIVPFTLTQTALSSNDDFQFCVLTKNLSDSDWRLPQSKSMGSDSIPKVD
jgi:hypothetical protein